MNLLILLLPIFSAGLTVIALYVLKPWAGAYAGEKGKNLARKEDLDAIVAEMRAVTIAQKEIEHKLSGDLWDRQMRWNQKKEMYVDLLTSCHQISTSLNSIIGLGDLILRDGPISAEKYRNILQGFVDKLNAGKELLMKGFALSSLFANEHCARAFLQYYKEHDLPMEISLDYVLKEREKIKVLLLGLMVAGKLDLGIDIEEVHAYLTAL